MKIPRRLAVLLLAFLLLLPGVALAADPQDAILQEVGVDEKPGAAIPRDLPFTDTSGKPVRLADYLGDGPVLLTLNYYTCPMLCPLTFRSLTATMAQVKGFSLARDYRVVTVSIDPDEIPEIARAKANETVAGVTEAVFAYVAANLLTSLFAAVFVLVSLTLLNVPAAVMLAVLAGVCDFVPILGFFVALTPAVLVALTISPGTAVAVAGLYGLCSVIENYAIAPRVYGHHLKVSRVAVLLGLVIGAALGGIIGALLALPVVAAYPIVERIWLRESLGKNVLAEHARLEHEGE